MTDTTPTFRTHVTEAEVTKLRAERDQARADRDRLTAARDRVIEALDRLDADGHHEAAQRVRAALTVDAPPGAVPITSHEMAELLAAVLRPLEGTDWTPGSLLRAYREMHAAFEDSQAEIDRLTAKLAEVRDERDQWITHHTNYRVARLDLAERVIAEHGNLVRGIRSLMVDTDGGHLDDGEEIPVGELRRVLAEAAEAADRDDERRARVDIAALRGLADALNRQQAKHPHANYAGYGDRILQAIGETGDDDQRDHLRRLLSQTTAALNVALHHLKDRPGLLDDAAHEQRENELAGCRIALEEATEAVTAADLGSPSRAQGEYLAPVIAHQWSVRYPDGFVDGGRFTEAGARQRADELGGEVVYRPVGEWQKAVG